MPYGVSNSFKRGTMRTYGARRSLAAPDTQRRVRIRMDARGYVYEEHADAKGPPRRISHAQVSTTDEPSSPTSQKLFSDVDDGQLTSESPPSSPPMAHHPPTHAKRSLKRKRTHAYDAEPRKRASQDEPLGEARDNANARQMPSQQNKSKRTRLTQLQLDLGGTTRRTCRECGMEYVPSSREDERLHRDFHSLNVGGVDLGTGFAKDSHIVERFGFGEVVALLDARSSPALRRRVRRVLDVVRSDLGAVDISDELLWGSGAKKVEGEEDRYKLLVYLAGDKCVGLVLAERIRHAAQVVDATPVPVPPCVNIDDGAGAEHGPSPSTTKKDSDGNVDASNIIPSSPTAHAAAAADDDASAPAELPDSTPSALLTETSIAPMLLGIARVWVSRSHRRKGIATTLLEAARGNFFYGIEVPRAMVAFSQPTESGRQLAADWFGARVGWHVYAES